METTMMPITGKEDQGDLSIPYYDYTIIEDPQLLEQYQSAVPEKR